MDSVARSGEPASSDDSAGTRGAVLDAALHELADCELHDILKCLTPGRIARGQRFSSSTVRYHFGREPARFDREALGAALVDALVTRLTAHARSSALGYRQAIEAVGAGAGIDALEQALAHDLEPFIPGAAGAQETASDRLYLLAVAMCDSSGPLTARLRSMREEILTSYDAVYEAVLAATGRRMAAGTTVRDLTLTINAFLEGLTVLGRQHAVMDERAIAGGVLRITWAFTVEADAPDVDIAAEFLASVVRPAPSSRSAECRTTKTPP